MRILFLFLFLLFSFHSYSQFFPPFPKDTSTTVANNTGSCEVFGHGRSWISINYERIFKLPNKHFLYTLRAGVGGVPGFTTNDEYYRGTITVPVVASFLAGIKHHFAQVSLGYSYSFGDPYVDSSASFYHINQQYEPAFSTSFGYRYLGLEITLAIYYTLIWTNNPTDRYSHNIGFSIGRQF